ncbi:hypothetical protein [Sanguibacter sp. Z1732]
MSTSVDVKAKGRANEILGVNEQATKIKDSRGYTVFRWFNAFF